jgi:hypothetical protein
VIPIGIEKLGAWCRRQRIAAEFEIRTVRAMDVAFVILRAESNASTGGKRHNRPK